jgi:hypothetical protein
VDVRLYRAHVLLVSKTGVCKSFGAHHIRTINYYHCIDDAVAYNSLALNEHPNRDESVFYTSELIAAILNESNDEHFWAEIRTYLSITDIFYLNFLSMNYAALDLGRVGTEGIGTTTFVRNHTNITDASGNSVFFYRPNIPGQTPLI